LLQGREVNVTDSVAACTVGATMCTQTHSEGQNDQSHNLLQCSLRSHLAEIINKFNQSINHHIVCLPICVYNTSYTMVEIQQKPQYQKT